jgi:hypothetical protein
MPTPGGQTPLEVAAIAARNSLIAINTYNVIAGNNYGATHTRALADNLTPNYGKGTGGYLDIQNYFAGSEWDRNGNPLVALGGGRNPALSDNQSTWGYGPAQNYIAPNTSLNVGQVII